MRMGVKDSIPLILLVAIAVWIWTRNTMWLASEMDVLPILMAIPLFLWLGRPWQLKTSTLLFSPRWMYAGVLFLVSGILLDLTLFLALGWTLLLWGWLLPRTDEREHSKIRKLLVLPLLAFPWISLDANAVGWWFRLTGAIATADLFSLSGHVVMREGTDLLINGFPVSVEAACSGLNTLQAMLIAGMVPNALMAISGSRYWWNILLLIFLSWVANVIRIIALVLAAMFISPAFALGSFHTIGGGVILLVMFAISWYVIEWESKYVS